MDEPTSSLSRADTERLYTIIRKLKTVGVAVIYISHRMEEIFEITDRVFVLRDGRQVGDLRTRDTDSQHLVNLIVGKSFSELYPKQDVPKGRVILEVQNLSYFNVLRNISFKVREGEIVAIYGLLGSGMHKLLNVLVGDVQKTRGDIFIDGEKIEISHPFFAKKNRIGFIPTDRREEGIAQNLDVKSNVVSANIENIGPGVVFGKNVQKERTAMWIKKLNIKTPGQDQLMQFLSGGNQQKVVIAKWLEAKSKILFMSEPSRGIDVGAKAEIYTIIEELCKEGMGVVMVSTELPEIMSISDRILVMKKGEIVKEVNTKETSQEELMSTVCS
jgi:ABC-type sugar transport system ATPase subunit